MIKLLYLFSLIFLFLYIWRSLVPAIKAKLIINKLIQQRKNIKFSNKPASFHIYVLIPLYNEQNILNTVYCNLEYLSENAPSNVSIYLITSERERYEDEHLRTTNDLIKEYIWNSNIKHIHLNLTYGGKGTVLNEAIQALNIPSDSWIAVYDADSLPEKEVFHYINSYQGSAQIMQQPCYYLLNYCRLNPVLKSQALFQTIWSIGKEYPKYERYSLLINKSLSTSRLPYLYLVGHGLIIKHRCLKILNGFPAKYEDLRLGIPVLMQRLPIHVIPFFDCCTFVYSIREWIKQSRNWMNGSWFILSDLHHLLSSSRGVHKFYAVVLTLKGIISNITWAIEGAFLPSIILLTFFLSGFKFLFLFLVLTCYLFTEALVFNWAVKDLNLLLDNSFDPKVNIFASLIRSFLRSLGPFLNTLECILRLSPNQRLGVRSSDKRRKL